MSDPAIHPAREEEYSFFLSAIWRCFAGWVPIPFPLRGPGSAGCLGTPLGMILFSRKPPIFGSRYQDWIGAKVVGDNLCLGSYGMGGPAFMGIRIAKGGRKRWLIYRLWEASEWLTLNGKPFGDAMSPSADKDQADAQLPSVAMLQGAILASYDCDDNQLTLGFTDGAATLELKVTRDGRDVPPWPNGELKQFQPEEKIEECLILCRSNNIWS